LNTEKRTEDTEFRKQSIKDICEQLEALNASLIKGKQKRLKTKEDILKKVGGILKSKKTGNYFKVNTKDDLNCPLGFVLEYTTDETKIESDKRLDGTFVIQTDHPDFEGEKLVKIFKDLNAMETAFRTIKNNIDIRPMYH
jgi:transposase